MGDRVAAIEHDIDEFRERVKPLAQCYSTKLDPDDHRQLAAAADELIKRLDETRTSVSNRERAKEQEEVNRQLLERQEQRLKQVALEIDALLAAGGATDTEEFRRRVRLHEQRQELERRRDEHIRSLERISGPGDKLTAFRESLAGSDPSQLAEGGGLVHEDGKAVLVGAGGVGAGATVGCRLGCGPATGAQLRSGGSH